MKIVFMGTPDISVPALENIIKAGYDVCAAVTNPDRAKGRSSKLIYSPVKECALAHGIVVLQPEKARDASFKAELKALDPDLAVVMAYGQIIDKELLEIPKLGCINIHASLLPKYRGAAPISAVILNGEKKTGVTTMYMDEGIDTGDLLLSKEIEISDKETCGSLEEKIAAVGAELILETLTALENGTLKRIPQEGEASYVKMIKKQAGVIDWTDSAVNIERKVRAFNPWPGSFTYYDGLIMKIYSADVVECSGYAPGVIAESKDRLLIQTGKGGLEIQELQLEGKKRMQTSDFLRGCKILPGEVLKSE